MRPDYFEKWKSSMDAFGMLDSVGQITDAPLDMYWRFMTVCNQYKKINSQVLDILLGNLAFKHVEGAMPEGEYHILPYPGPADLPMPFPDIPLPPPYIDPIPPFLPTETYFFNQVVKAEGGPAQASAGIPQSEEDLIAFIDNLWGFPSLDAFLATIKNVAVQHGRETVTAFDFFDQFAMGDWETLYGKLKLLIAGDVTNSLPYFDAQMEQMEGASYESYGAAIGGAAGGVVGALIGGGSAGAATGGAGAGHGAVYGGGIGAAAGGCVGAYIGSCIDEWTS